MDNECQKQLIKELEEDFNLLADNYDNVFGTVITDRFFDVTTINPVFFTDDLILKIATHRPENIEHLAPYIQEESVWYQIINTYSLLSWLQFSPITEGMINCLYNASIIIMSEKYFEFEISSLGNKTKALLNQTKVIRQLCENKSTNNKLLHHLEKQIQSPFAKADKFFYDACMDSIKKHPNYNSAQNILDSIQESV